MTEYIINTLVFLFIYVFLSVGNTWLFLIAQIMSDITSIVTFWGQNDALYTLEGSSLIKSILNNN